MLMVIAVLLLALGWTVWNLYQQAERLELLMTRNEEITHRLRPEQQAGSGAGTPSDAAAPAGGNCLRVIIEITDAVELAKRHSKAGGAAGAVAPNVLKKAMYGRVLEETTKSLEEAGQEAEVKVIVL